MSIEMRVQVSPIPLVESHSAMASELADALGHEIAAHARGNHMAIMGEWVDGWVGGWLGGYVNLLVCWVGNE